MTHTHQIVIIGAGTAGITVAAQLQKKDRTLDIAIIDPATTHYYQPAWTLVGAGTFDYQKTARPMATLIPNGINWIKEAVASFLPSSNQLQLNNGSTVYYDYLVVCPGIQINLGDIKGLKETIGKNNVCSNYIDAKYTWEVLQKFRGGNALFTQPSTPIKCGGAPQKIMYLADDYFQQQGIKNATNVIFATPGSVIFGVPDFAKTLLQVVDRKAINLKFFHKLVKIDGTNKVAYYKAQDVDGMLEAMQGDLDEMGSQEEMLDNRNKKWIPQIIEMSKEAPTFYAVGAGHLGGETGVIRLLRKEGFKVTPVTK